MWRVPCVYNGRNQILSRSNLINWEKNKSIIKFFGINCIGFETISNSSERSCSHSCRYSKTSIEMKEFSVFEYHKLVLTKLGIYPTHSQSTNSVFLKSLSYSSCCILVILIAIFVSGSIFMYENVSELTVVIRSCILTFASAQSIGMFYFYAINMDNIHGVHSKLQEIIHEIIEGRICTFWILLIHFSSANFHLFVCQRWSPRYVQHILWVWN